jgi:hypothetical protein
MQKKGSLSLSYNAVVTLVLSIAMLSLGIGFTKQMFNRFGSTLEIPPPDMWASEENPIVLNSELIEVKRNKQIILPVRFYSSFNGEVYPALNCYCPTGPGLLWHDGASHGDLNALSNWMQFGQYEMPPENERAAKQKGCYLGSSKIMTHGEQATFQLILDKTFMGDKSSIQCTLKFKARWDWTWTYIMDDSKNKLLAEKQIAFRIS